MYVSTKEVVMFKFRISARVVGTVGALVLLVAACGSDSSTSDDIVAVAVSDAEDAATTPASDERSQPSSDEMVAEPTVAPESEAELVDALVLSAFLAVVDAGNPAGIAGLSGCEQEAGDDAIPVIFSVQVDESTLDASDFSVETASGAQYTPTCATLSPADEPDEGYTVLMTGPLGDAADRPVSVSVVGELAGRDGADLSALESPTITDGPGPTLILAIETDAGEACAALGSDVEIQTVWQSSVNGSSETAAAISLVSADGDANPTGFDDDGDSDNHVVLCVPPGHDTTRVEVGAGVVSNPAGLSNPEVSVEL